MTQNESTIDPHVLRLFYSLRDFQFSLSAFDFFLEVDAEAKHNFIELRRYRCYLDAGIIAYGRPFTKAKGTSPFAMGDIGVSPTQRQSDLHRELLDYRHKVVAHSDGDRMRIAVNSFSPLKERPDIRMPWMRVDEGLPFLDDRLEIIDWLRLLIHKLCEETFSLAQSDESLRFTKDYLAPSANE